MSISPIRHSGSVSGNYTEDFIVRAPPEPKVLLLSQRRIADLAAYCLAYEFEDVFAAVADAQRIDVTDFPGLEFSRRAYKLARLAFGSPRLALKLARFPRGESGRNVGGAVEVDRER